MENKLKHIAIIMDGNGRWAQKRGMTRSMGHKKGASTLEKLASHINDLNIEYLSIYAFSTDNFKRSKEEVDYLMNLFIEMFNKKFKKLQAKGIKVIFSGDKNGLRKDVVNSMDSITKKTENNNGSVLNICLNYGSQEEIIRAANRYHDDLITKKISKNDINRDNFYKYMDNYLPPIDLLIRTGGEKRLSNFMLYQLTYAEIYFIDTLFPDFTIKKVDKIIDNFYLKDRRFGGINDEKKTNN
ncbi:MAG: polyprenyl diphosphate synthase [Bacilli bacterium]